MGRSATIQRMAYAFGRGCEDARIELSKTRQLVAELVAVVDTLKAQVAELEAAGAASLYAQALQVPGVKAALINAYHTDKHPDAPEATRRTLNEGLVVILAAYRSLEGRK